MLSMDDAQRRARVGLRHGLVPSAAATDVVEAADVVVALHGTDPAGTVLSAVVRTPGSRPADVETALYEERSLVRVLAMRRTVFAVRPDLAPACAAASDGVARSEERKLVAMVAAAGLPEPERVVARAEAEALAVFAELENVTTKDLTSRSGLLATRVPHGSGRWAGETALAPRVLTTLSAKGLIVRARPRGGWTSTQFSWCLAERWHPALAGRIEPQAAATQVAEAWLRRYGPATPEDLQWWTGWTKTRTKAALAALDLVEVDTATGPAVVLADDTDPVAAPEPWVALLPALDPTAMGWKHRHHLLGEHREQVYDVNGNAGPTVWADGRVVGGWAQRDDGEVVAELFDDVGGSVRSEVERRAGALQELLGDVRLKARARGWTPVEKRLRS